MNELKNGKNFDKHTGQTILGIDYGSKVIGLALFTPGREPFPLPFGKIINSSNLPQTLKDLKETIDNECVEIIVLGLPLHKDGNPSEMTEIVKNFGKSLIDFFPSIELIYQDETLTSFEAKSRMENSPQYNFKVDLKKIDALAASIIIEDFLKN